MEAVSGFTLSMPRSRVPRNYYTEQAVEQQRGKVTYLFVRHQGFILSLCNGLIKSSLADNTLILSRKKTKNRFDTLYVMRRYRGFASFAFVDLIGRRLISGFILVREKESRTISYDYLPSSCTMLGPTKENMTRVFEHCFFQCRNQFADGRSDVVT